MFSYNIHMKNKLIYFLLILCVLFWSGNFVVGRYVKDEIEAIEMVFFRWLFTLIIISPVLILKHKNIINSFKKNYYILFPLALLGITLFNTILYIGLHTTTATNALIINSSIPILILILSFILFKQKANLRQIIAILLSTFGVLFIVLKGEIFNIINIEFTKGDLYIILAAIIWALYSIFVKFKPKDLSDFEFFSSIVFLGFMLLLPVYFYQGYSLNKEIELLKNNYLVFLYISIFTSVLSYYFWHKGIKAIGASVTSQFTHLMPFFGAILAYIFLDEVMQFYHIIGALLIALGIYLSLLKTK